MQGYCAATIMAQDKLHFPKNYPRASRIFTDDGVTRFPGVAKGRGTAWLALQVPPAINAVS